MQARAAGAGSSNRIERSHNDWFRSVLVQDVARMDALLGLVISIMADAEAKGEVGMHPGCHAACIHVRERYHICSMIAPGHHRRQAALM